VRVSEALRAELAERAIEADIAKLISYRLISIQKRGGVPNYEASMNKNFRSELSQRLAQTGMKVIGMYGNVYGDTPLAAEHGRLSRRYLSSVSATIAAGTSEINRNVIATRGLGLPRG
jgi:3-oxocholest-4-en-26-oyl-CoA dehydrogenase alpha subunit